VERVAQCRARVGRRVKRFINIEAVARRKLRQLQIAGRLEDLRVPPGNRLEALKGSRAGQHSIRVNDQFRVCFRWTSAGAEDVEIVAGKRAITADTDLRLCRFFGLSNGYWLRAQAAYDTEVAETALAKTLAKIKPWTGAAA
jgi:proteic killer suppression protein